MVIIIAAVIGGVFSYYLGLNILLGVTPGILLGFGLTGKYIFSYGTIRWLFHAVFIASFLAMIFLLSGYVSGQIISVCALWAVSSAVFSYRETRLTTLSNSSGEKK